MITLIVAAVLAADEPQAMEAEGQAALSLGYTQAVQQAKDQALRNILLAACKQTMAADKKIEQCAQADDRVFAAFKGGVQNLEVLSTESAGEVVKVKLRAMVSLKNVSNDELETQRLYRAMGKRKISIGIQEQIVEDSRWGSKRAVQGVALLSGPLSAIVREDGWQIFALPAFSGLDIGVVVEAAKGNATDYALVGEISFEVPARNPKTMTRSATWWHCGRRPKARCG